MANDRFVAAERPAGLGQLAPRVAQIKRNTGRQARELSADAGHCSEGNLAVLARRYIEGCITTGRQRHGRATASGRRRGGGARTANGA